MTKREGGKEYTDTKDYCKKKRYVLLFLRIFLLVFKEFREKVVHWGRSFKEGFANKVHLMRRKAWGILK